MTTWNKPVSWSKFKLALDCPRQLQYTIDKKPISDTRTNYYAEIGTTIQFVFEQIFNQQINQRPGGAELKVFEKSTEKILQSNWFRSKTISYPFTKTEEDLKNEVREGVRKGWEMFTQLKISHQPIRSEVKWFSVFRNTRLFALIDFVFEGNTGLYLFDGKGHARKDADERQLLFYALTVHGSSRTVAGGGFLYWKHGIEKLDLSPAKIHEFADGPFVEGKKVMDQLKVGIMKMPAKPGAICTYCPWKNVCPDSAKAVKEADHEQSDTVGFKLD